MAGPRTPVVSTASGMESMRGFDIFMKVAKKICDRRQPVQKRPKMQFSSDVELRAKYESERGNQELMQAKVGGAAPIRAS